MKNVRWTRAAANKSRVLRTKDLDRLGIKHKGQDLVWNKDNNFTLEMSNQMSDSLVEKLPEFIATDADGVDETSEVQDPMTSLASSTAGSDEGSPEESEASGDDEVQASTGRRSRNR